MGYRFGTTHTLACTGTAATSSAIGDQTYMIRVACPVAFHIAIGSTAAATTAKSYVPGNWVEDIHVSPGQIVGIISASTSTGTFSLTELV